jgi:glutathione synthase
MTTFESPARRTGMRLCFVVNNVRTQKPTYTTLCLAYAGHRRGHDVAFASVDAFSQGEGPEIVADVVRPKPGRLRDATSYARALTSPTAPHEDARLADFDVIFLRNNPNSGAKEGDAFNPALDFAARLKSQGVLVVNDPDGLSRAGSKLYLAGFPADLRPLTLMLRSF